MGVSGYKVEADLLTADFAVQVGNQTIAADDTVILATDMVANPGSFGGFQISNGTATSQGNTWASSHTYDGATGPAFDYYLWVRGTTPGRSTVLRSKHITGGV